MSQARARKAAIAAAVISGIGILTGALIGELSDVAVSAVGLEVALIGVTVLREAHRSAADPKDQPNEHRSVQGTCLWIAFGSSIAVFGLVVWGALGGGAVAWVLLAVLVPAALAAITWLAYGVRRHQP